jgi:hypothetical protein
MLSRFGSFIVLQFIVLGIVPGTNLQLDFELLLTIAGACISLFLLSELLRLLAQHDKPLSQDKINAISL